jgi:hypothetical protein
MENENENDDPIVHCGECKWWEQAWENSAHGMCHVNAPAIDGSRWPETNQSRWCGQGRPKGRVASQLVRVDGQDPERPMAQTPTAKDLVTESRVKALEVERDEWKEVAQRVSGEREYFRSLMNEAAHARDYHRSLICHIGELFYPASWMGSDKLLSGGVLIATVPMLVEKLVAAYKEEAGAEEWDKLREAKLNRTTKRPAPSCLCGGVGCNSCEPQGRG